jgi:mercuric ion binding protein
MTRTHGLLAATAFAVAALASPAAHAAEKSVTLAVQNMFCAACPGIVKRALEAVNGVSRVEVSYRDNTAVVIFDDGKTDVNALTAATTSAGYPSAPRS